MCELYKFEAEQFGVSDDSIHLLRNRFNYQTINFKEIDSVTIKTGKDLKNWVIVLLIGIGLLGFVVFDVYRIYLFFFGSEATRVYLERLLVPVFPLMLGLYSVRISLRVSKVMILQVHQKNYYFSLRKLLKEDKFNDFKQLMKEKYSAITILD